MSCILYLSTIADELKATFYHSHGLEQQQHRNPVSSSKIIANNHISINIFWTHLLGLEQHKDVEGAAKNIIARNTEKLSFDKKKSHSHVIDILLYELILPHTRKIFSEC